MGCTLFGPSPAAFSAEKGLGAGAISENQEVVRRCTALLPDSGTPADQFETGSSVRGAAWKAAIVCTHE